MLSAGPGRWTQRMAVALHSRPGVITRSICAFFLIFLLFTAATQAATFVVPDDRTMVHSASTIVVASALHSYSEQLEDGRIETVTTMSIEEVIKGAPGSERIDVREPGGAVDD